MRGRLRRVELLAQLEDQRAQALAPGIDHQMRSRAVQRIALRVQREIGDDTLSARLDWFEVDHRTVRPSDDADEDGWAATVAWRHRLADHLDLIVEAQHVESERPARFLAGDAADQGQTGLSAALRISF